MFTHSSLLRVKLVVKFSHNKLKNADDIFVFLDSVDKNEYKRVLPSNEEMLERWKVEESRLHSKIESLKQNIQDYQEMLADLSRQKNEYTTSVMMIQADIDRTIKDKERLSKELEEKAAELESLQQTKTHDPTAQIQKRVDSALAAIKKQSKEKLEEAIKKVTEEAARKASMEFAPHINQLKAKHNTEIAILKNSLAKEISSVKETSRAELSRVLASMRQQFFEQTEQQVEIIDRDNTKALESLRKKCERERVRHERDIDRVLKSIERETKEVRARYQREMEMDRVRGMRQIEECQNDLKSAKRIAEQQIQRIEEAGEQNQVFTEKVVCAEYDLMFEERNKAVIASKTAELAEQLEEDKRRINFDTDNAIAEQEIEMNEKIEGLSNEISFIKSEIKRLRRIEEKEASFRRRNEKRRQAASEELENAKATVAQLQKILLEATKMVCVAPTLDLEAQVGQCNQIKHEISQIKIQQVHEESTHKTQLELAIQKQKANMAKTAAKIKSVIEAKDRVIDDLKQQLATARQKIDALAKLMHK